MAFLFSNAQILDSALLPSTPAEPGTLSPEPSPVSTGVGVRVCSLHGARGHHGCWGFRSLKGGRRGYSGIRDGGFVLMPVWGLVG